MTATTTRDPAAPAFPVAVTPDPAPVARRRRPVPVGLVLAWAVLATVLLWAVLPGALAPFDAYTSVAAGLQAPGGEHLFGTDANGRDLFSRVVHGASESLAGAAVAVTLGLTAGTLLGVVAGTVGGVVEEVLMRVVDVLLAIPGLLLALTVVVLLGPGTVNAALAVGVGAVAGFARLVRAEVVQVRATEYVEAAYGSGGRVLSVLWRHVLRNSLRPVVALAAMQVGTAILALSTLGFLGYGVTPPDPEWGMIIAQGRDLLAAAWWVTTLPGLVIVAVVLSANRVSRSLGSER
ncbi:peptide/nickel transport system permease protein [Georgenia satyanarayanai]|uniref:Peptide/nickel transport system permease protein n=1 Tax=Georgenia satyanarayanai TaxID=860221 RepID=A0A2Y9C4S6_9MICO|nr:ABC transporter permease [Georgenia satyanarayanai]PYG00070.1 peptide/nickel transport system permease protein [Georgenia satyanarayanai]SSA40093.1 peptide/nickel transport system permease protein [Georgenia satyanarayanai]